MKIWTPSIDPGLSYYRRGEFILIWRFALLFTVVFGILALVTLRQSLWIGFTFYFAIFLLSLFSIIYLHKVRKPRTIFWLFTVSASIAVILSMNILVDTLHYSDLMWIMCIILFAFIGLKFKQALIFVVVHFVSLIYFLFFELNSHVEVLKVRNVPELFTTGFEISFAFLVMCALLYQNLKFQNFAHKELRKAHDVLANQNKENVTLLREVHHRVKNNLQIVISLLRMQSANIPNEETTIHFNSAINRIMTISLIHNKLYNSDILSSISFRQYLDELISEIKTLHDNNGNMNVSLRSDIDKLDINSMISLGLILNELVTNSVKHASEGVSDLNIHIHFEQMNDGAVKMTYSDNGQWKENTRRGFGMELIESLSGQLDGRLSREGSVLTIDFSVEA